MLLLNMIVILFCGLRVQYCEISLNPFDYWMQEGKSPEASYM